MTTTPDAARIREAAQQLKDGEASVRILRGLAWPAEVKERFFAQGEAKLPTVEYPPFDSAPVIAQVDLARRGFDPESVIGRWIHRTADAIATGARLLSARGTPEFLEHGISLFGSPKDELGGACALALAETIDAQLDDVAGLDLGVNPPESHAASEVADKLRESCHERFGEEAPEVLVVDELSSNALAGPRRIRVRNGARFSDRDVDQLIQHEAFVHVCTSLNEHHQKDLPILAASHSGTTRTQEGLAVFAEFISGSLDPDRFRRLADRVVAIQMSIDGADFMEVYRYFLGRGVVAEQAFENARRVLRGGVMTGGAPFTKDSVYLDGFLRVTNFFRAIAGAGEVDCLLLLFCGKLDLEDLPALAELTKLGLCQPPRYLPPWIADRRFLVTYLAYSSFLSGTRLDHHRQRYDELLSAIPK